jgi:DNA-binding MarR family transcriptional regulator
VGHASEAGFLVLHGLRLKGFAGAPVLAELAGINPTDVDNHLDKLQADGLVQYRDGRVTGWSLTPSGRAVHADRCREEVATSGARELVDLAYRRFLDVNEPFLVACTDWQLRAGADGVQAINDHTDAAHDRAVIGRLRDIHGAVLPICADLSRVMERFEPYAARLQLAIDRVEAGQQEWFTGALIESYHTVWFELHEDMLVTLGIARDSEANR